MHFQQGANVPKSFYAITKSLPRQNDELRQKNRQLLNSWQKERRLYHGGSLVESENKLRSIVNDLGYRHDQDPLALIKQLDSDRLIGRRSGSLSASGSGDDEIFIDDASAVESAPTTDMEFPDDLQLIDGIDEF